VTIAGAFTILSPPKVHQL